MTASDIETIERQLGIRLPEVYRQRVISFPVPCLAGNRHTELWDDPDALVICNSQLRNRKEPLWPSYLFMVGQNEGDPAVRAIDLRAPDTSPVWWLDHADVHAAGSGETHPRFEQWADSYVTAIRRDLACSGHDPDSPPSAYKSRIAKTAGRQRWALLCLALLGLAALVIYAFIRGHP